VEVNAFQRLSDVVIQKSLREGFGLVVSDTLWKRTPIVAGRARGIPFQVRGGVGGFLVDSVEECAEKTLWALQHPEEAEEYGVKGHELVRERFLLTRLIADELRLYGSLLGRRLPYEPVAQAGLAGRRGTRYAACGSTRTKRWSTNIGARATASAPSPAANSSRLPRSIFSGR